MRMTNSRRGAAMASMIDEVGRDLARTFTGVLDAIPGAPHRPLFLARSLRVNTVLTSRVLKAAQQPDPLAVAHLIPGPEPLRRLLRAAERKKINPALIRDAHAAVDRFQHLIDVEAGDRSGLDAIISGWLPDAREKVELLAKQSVFRGVSQLLGFVSDVEHHTFVQYPSPHIDGRADQVCLCVTQGLRRVRPGLVVKYETVHSAGPLQTITGQPVEGLHSLLLEQFCSKPLPQLQVTRYKDRAQYTLSGDDIGVRSAVHLAYATLLQGHKELHRLQNEAPRLATLSVGIGAATRTFIFDVLVHDDVYPGLQPTLHLYRAMPFGPASPNDPSRDVDRLDVIQTIQPLGRGIARFRTADNPAHLDLLRHVCEQRGWDGSRLRGYRCRIEYPMYNSEIVMAFDLPLKPA